MSENKLVGLGIGAVVVLGLGTVGAFKFLKKLIMAM